MSNEEMKKATKKVALGRGLNSLLGGDSFNVHETLKPTHKPVAFHELEEASLKEGFVQGEVTEKKETTAETPDGSRVWQIGVEKLSANKDQPRKEFEAEHLESLALSIKEKGIIQPITARKLENGKFEIIAGERRWRAAQRAGLQQVPVIINNLDNKEALEVALIENIQRRDLNPIEEAEAYFNLIKKYRLTQQMLAERLGKERATVANILRLLNLSPEVRKMISVGEISLGQGKVLLKLTDPKKQKNLALRARDKDLSVRMIEKLVDKELATPGEEGGLAADTIQQLSMIQSLESEMQKLMGTKVSIDYNSGKGKMVVSFYTDEELNQIIEKLRESCKS